MLVGLTRSLNVVTGIVPDLMFSVCPPRLLQNGPQTFNDLVLISYGISNTTVLFSVQVLAKLQLCERRRVLLDWLEY